MLQAAVMLWGFRCVAHLYIRYIAHLWFANW